MIISQDERIGKTNAVLSGFTSIIHPLNKARTMRTKLACVKRSPWATRVKEAQLEKKKKKKKQVIFGTPVRWTCSP